jgi:hypothetical protein
MNRFHNKWHRRNHHTYGNTDNPDASHDPIASPTQPFLGDFSLSGGLSAVAPLSAYAGYFYSNNTAISAYGGIRGALLYSFGYLGAAVQGNTVFGLSAMAPFAAIVATSPMIGLSSYGSFNSIQAYSDNIGLSAFGYNKAANLYSPFISLSAFGGQQGIKVVSPATAIDLWGGNIGINAYSKNLVFAGNTPATGINVSAGQVGAVLSSPVIALSAGGGGITVLNTRVGIYKTPQDHYSLPQQAGQVVLDVAGDAWFDGSLTIMGDLSAFGTMSYLDTHVGVTSSMVVNNSGTDAALTVIQTGNEPIFVCFDQDIDPPHVNPSFIVDGSTNGWVGIGLPIPTAPFTIQKNNSGTQSGSNNPQVRITDDGSTTKIALGTYGYNQPGGNSNPYIGTETSQPFDIYTNNYQRITTLANGNVGINSSFPKTKLAVYSNDATSNNIAISAFAPSVAVLAYSLNRGVSAFGINVGVEAYSLNRGISSFGINVGVEAYSLNRGISSFGINVGVEAYSLNRGVSAFGSNVGVEAYSLNRGISSFGINVGVEAYSLNRGVSAFGSNVGVEAYSLGTALSAWGANYGAVIAGGLTNINKDGGGSTNINSNNTVATTVNIGNTSATLTLKGITTINDAAGTNTTNIGTGGTTGNVTLGNSAAVLALAGSTASLVTAGQLDINSTTPRATNINIGAGAATTTIGNNGTVAINGATTIAGNTTISIAAGNTLNVGNSTGAVTLAGSTLGITTAGQIDINSTTPRATNINIGAGAATTTIGNNGTVAINGTTTIAGNATIANTAGNTLTAGNSTGATTINGTTVGINGTTTIAGALNVNTTTGLATNLNTGAGAVATTIGNNTASNTTVINSPSVTAPNQAYVDGTSVLNGSLGDTRYGNYVNNRTAGSSNTTNTLNTTNLVVGAVTLAANTTYQIDAAAILSTSSTGGSKVAFVSDGTLNFSVVSIEEVSYSSASATALGATYLTMSPNTSTKTSAGAETHTYKRSGFITTGNAGGVLYFQHAGNSAGNTTPQTGSYLIARKIV